MTKKTVIIGMIISFLILLAGIVAQQVFEWKRGPIEGVAATLQVEDSTAGYDAMRIATSNVIPKMVWCITLVLLIITWYILWPRRVKEVSIEQ